MNLKRTIPDVIIGAAMSMVALGFTAIPSMAEQPDKELMKELCEAWGQQGGAEYTYWENSNGEYGCDYMQKNGKDQTIICVEGGDHCLKLFDDGTQQAGGGAGQQTRPAPGSRLPALGRPQPTLPTRAVLTPPARSVVRR